MQAVSKEGGFSGSGGAGGIQGGLTKAVCHGGVCVGWGGDRGR